MEKKANAEKQASAAMEPRSWTSQPLASPSPVGWRCRECSQTRSSSDMLRGDGLCERCRAKL